MKSHRRHAQDGCVFGVAVDALPSAGARVCGQVPAIAPHGTIGGTVKINQRLLLGWGHIRGSLADDQKQKQDRSAGKRGERDARSGAAAVVKRAGHDTQFRGARGGGGVRWAVTALVEVLSPSDVANFPATTYTPKHYGTTRLQQLSIRNGPHAPHSRCGASLHAYTAAGMRPGCRCA